MDNVLNIKEKTWFHLFSFIPNNIIDLKMKKSAIVSLLLASLNKVNDGKIILNQKDHFEKIMIRVK